MVCLTAITITILNNDIIQMKKLASLAVIFIVAVAMVSCTRTSSKDGEKVSKNEPVVEYTREYGNVQKHYSNGLGNIRDGRYFNFNGHSYIQFDINDSYGGYAVVHDPDCPCMKSSNQ